MQWTSGLIDEIFAKNERGFPSLEINGGGWYRNTRITSVTPNSSPKRGIINNLHISRDPMNGPEPEFPSYIFSRAIVEVTGSVSGGGPASEFTLKTRLLP